MRVHLDGKMVYAATTAHPIAAAALDALVDNGATRGGPERADIALLCFDLLPREDADPGPLLAEAESICSQMAVRGGGRLVIVASALASMPARRHGKFSVAMARVPAIIRVLAMLHGPHVLVNGVGVGAIGNPLLCGDAAMLGHASIQRVGTIEEVVDPILFFCDPMNTYTTGQFLSIDGGWAAGYARSF